MFIYVIYLYLMHSRKYFDDVRKEDEAVVRHYIMTHPELFPEPKRVKYIDHIQPWVPCGRF